MNIEIIIVIGVLIIGFFLFIKEYFSIDVTALIILSCFFGLGYLTPTEAVSGFSNPAVITIGLLFVLSSAIQKTGLLEYIVVTINKLLQLPLSLPVETSDPLLDLLDNLSHPSFHDGLQQIQEYFLDF